MKTSLISTQAISEATRLSRAKLQERLAEAQKEVTTGRFADVGKSLGYMAGRTVSLRQELDRLTTLTESNGVATSRLQTSQTVLENVANNAHTFINSLIVARAAPDGASSAALDARAKLVSLTDQMNTSAGGTFIFAGINTDVKPLEDYFDTPAPASKIAVDNAFLSEFGLAQSTPGVELISAGAMNTFLDTTFANLFTQASWETTWSAASDQNILSRISTNELIETSTNANMDPIRALASAYTMIADLGVADLNDEAYQAVVDKAIGIAGQAVGDLTQTRASLGSSEERITAANDRMSLQVDIITNHISLLEGVDPYEASTEVNSLLTQIETAYALTARIQRLSLIDYL
jgi:flagellar hook-associated protein 3 FlgL